VLTMNKAGAVTGTDEPRMQWVRVLLPFFLAGNVVEADTELELGYVFASQLKTDGKAEFIEAPPKRAKASKATADKTPEQDAGGEGGAP
jgi:hypothetical protein